MKPIINLEENIGKTVGRRTGFGDPFDLQGSRKADMVAWKDAFGAPHLPKGVFRFKTHEEADEWLMKMLVKTRKI